MVGSLLFQSGYDRLGVNESFPISLEYCASTHTFIISQPIPHPPVRPLKHSQLLSYSQTLFFPQLTRCERCYLVIRLSGTQRPSLLRKQFCLPVPSLPSSSFLSSSCLTQYHKSKSHTSLLLPLFCTRGWEFLRVLRPLTLNQARTRCCPMRATCRFVLCSHLPLRRAILLWFDTEINCLLPI